MSSAQRTGGKALEDIARILQAELRGNRSLFVDSVTEPLKARTERDLALAMQPESLVELAQSRARMAVIAEGATVPDGLLDAYLIVKRPRYALATLLQLFDKPPALAEGTHPSAVIEASARIGANVSVGALVYIGEEVVIADHVRIMPHVTIAAGSQIGEAALLHSGVRIGENTTVGKRVIIHGNACIGADGFSFATPEKGSVEAAQTNKEVVEINKDITRVNSIGCVVLEDDVEVGACTTIDRATMGETVVRKGTKIDNLVMVAHNNVIGEHCLIAGQAGISGSCIIGDRVVMGGQVGIADHVKVGNDAVLLAKAGVAHNVPAKGLMALIPAIPYDESVERYKSIARLKHLFRDVFKLKKRVIELEKSRG